MISSSLITLPADLPDFRTWAADALERAAQEEHREARRLNRPRAVSALPRALADPGPLWHPTPTPFTDWKASQVWNLRQRVGSWLRLPRIIVGCVDPGDALHLGATRLDVDEAGLHVAIRLHARLSVHAFPGTLVHEFRHAWHLASPGQWGLSREAAEEDADAFVCQVLALCHQFDGRHALEPAWR